MKQTVTLNSFIKAFKVRPDDFSLDGLTALFTHLTELEEDCGTEIELDPIALCCEYSEVEKSEHLERYDDKDEANDLIIAEIAIGGVPFVIAWEG